MVGERRGEEPCLNWGRFLHWVRRPAHSLRCVSASRPAVLCAPSYRFWCKSHNSGCPPQRRGKSLADKGKWGATDGADPRLVALRHVVHPRATNSSRRQVVDAGVGDKLHLGAPCRNVGRGPHSAPLAAGPRDPRPRSPARPAPRTPSAASQHRLGGVLLQPAGPSGKRGESCADHSPSGSFAASGRAGDSLGFRSEAGQRNSPVPGLLPPPPSGG